MKLTTASPQRESHARPGTVFGDLSSGVRPLICLHGGPGALHNYLLRISQLAPLYGIPVVLYDQLGCGKRTRLREKAGDEAFWTIDLFLSELDNLLQHLGIQDDYDLLGHSWGGILGSSHAIRHPKGLHQLIIADSPSDMHLWVQAANKLRTQLPQDVQYALTKNEKAGTTESQEYEDAVMKFLQRFCCRLPTWPEEMLALFEGFAEDNTVYMTMNGPSDFFLTGTLKHWSIVDEIHKINVPTLLINGRYDEAQDEVMEPFFRSISKVKWVRFAESSHVPHIEETEEWLKVVSGFLLAK